MIQWSSELLDRVPWTSVIDNPARYQIEHFPSLLADECLYGQTDAIAKHVKANLRRGHAPHLEVVPMPRGLSGDRPVVCADLTSRIAYSGLVAIAESVLEPSSRQEETREQFREFGTDESDPGYVVMSDIAACYEYIVPRILADELFLRSDDYQLVTHLSDLLQELTTLERGIPQMLEPSDRLADLYLSIVDRSLDRAGLRWARTADDYKIVVPKWEEAPDALALLDREVRAVGLILSANKTRIVSAGTKARARSSSSPERDEELEAAEEDVPVEALLEWHQGWLAARRRNKIFDPPPTREIRRLDSADRLTVNLLADLVFAYPANLEYVVDVLVRLAEKSTADDELVTKAFNKLLVQVPKTPWSILWLLEGGRRLFATERLPSAIQISPVAVAGVGDDREVVRIQSAWILAKHYSLSAAQLRHLHLHASPLTMPGVSAVAALAATKASAKDKATIAQLANAIRGKQPLNNLAANWAKSHA